MRGSIWLPAASASAALLAATLGVQVTSAADGERKFRGGRVLTAGSGTTPKETPALRQKRGRGYLVADPAGYAAAKAKAAANASAGTGSQAPPVAAPNASTNAVGENFEGLVDTGVAPPQSHAAIGTTRFVQLVNRKYGIYQRDGTLIQSGSLAALTGISGTSLFDLQVIWDPDTERFYYSMNDIEAGGNYFAFGFSKTASPNSPSDFCQYKADFGYGTDFPDFPKLGTTTDFLILGVNAFDSDGFYLGSDILTISKPPPGSTCPAADSFALNAKLSVTFGDPIWAPLPAVQTDPNKDGWVLATRLDTSDSGLVAFRVTTGGSGQSDIEQIGRWFPADAHWGIPVDASQLGTTTKIDTFDARLTQAIAGVDPSIAGAPQVIWTQHTVDPASGPEAQVQWYEIEPRTDQLPIVHRKGVVRGSGQIYVFNGAISPDRRVNGSGRSFGSSMAIVFNSSSPTTYPKVHTATKLHTRPLSSWVTIRESPGFNQDFTCDAPEEPPCRWGDAAVTPDPLSDTSKAYGTVWFTNQWNVASATPSDTDWRTQNGSISPELELGSARVITSPPVPAQIILDGSIADTWGVWVALPPGQHQVQYRDVEGFRRPADQLFEVTAGQTTTVTAVYEPQGLLRVLTDPPLPGTIKIDGKTRNDWGMWTWFPPGQHEVCFGPVPDWLPPPCETVQVPASGSATVTGSYTSSPGAPGEPPGNWGYIRVVTDPPVPTQISLDGAIADSWGLTWVKAQSGTCRQLSFTDVAGYEWPNNTSACFTPGETRVVSKQFLPWGLLRVTTTPPVASTIFVDERARNDWGLWTWHPTGPHTVCFESTAGFMPPPCQDIVLTPGVQTTVNGTFTPNS